MHLRTLGLALICSALLPQPAAAFCGFYVAGAEEPLYNDATMVVLLREGTHTVLSMRNDYRGPPENFAMVVPVPEVLSENDVRTLDAAVFDRVDQLASPRLVEYWEQDPCSEEISVGNMPSSLLLGAVGTIGYGRGAGGSGVTIEAEFAVGEYDIVILSARDSGGLDAWLRDNDYRIPEGAEEALRPYVEAGTKFFIAKVDVSKVSFVEGRAVLSPLRIHYESEEFSLPVRLGMLNSSGTQDLIIHILADNQRYEVANYPNVTVPTNLDVRDGVRDRFSEMYAALFDATLEHSPGSVVTEYSWQASGCDPCPGGMTGLNATDLATLGEGGSWEESRSASRESYRLRQLTPLVQGELAVEIIRRVARRHQNELRYCHESSSGSPASFTGNINYTISSTGAVTTASATGPGSEALHACLANAARRWTFPAPTSGTVRVQQPIRVRTISGGPQLNGRFGRPRSPKVLTRLHYRYGDGELGADLVFRAASPIVGGREIPDEEGALSQDASEASTNNFQARYAIRHEWTGPIECEAPIHGRWGPRPAGPTEVELSSGPPTILGAAPSSITSAQNTALAPRGSLQLAAHLVSAVPALELDDTALASADSNAAAVEGEGTDRGGLVPTASHIAESSGCGCRLEGASDEGPSPAWLGLALLLVGRRRRGAA